MGRGLGPLQQAILHALAEREKPGMAKPLTTTAVAEDLAFATYQQTGHYPEVTDTRVRAVRRALDSLWRRGLVNKTVVTWMAPDAAVQPGNLIWRIHDPDREPEPAETTRDPYGRRIADD
jgi:hypothetical protein